MKEPRRYRSPALRSLHEAMENLHEVGAIDKAIMRDFDPANPRESSYEPSDVRAGSECAEILVSKWERGVVWPTGPSLKLLALANSKGIDAIL